MMIYPLKKLYSINKKLISDKLTENQTNPKTGLSPRNQKKIYKNRGFSGSTTFFGKTFHYNLGISFLHSVEEIFEGDIYKFYTKNPSPFIIDCGANMGVSCIYFMKNYPTSKIIAFEPDKETFSLLKKNIAEYYEGNKIELKEEAVWIKDEELEFFSEGGLSGSMVVDFAKKNNVTKIKAIDLKKYLNQKIDFLKIDIEGAENTVIFDIENYLHNIENLFLEYHGIIGEKQNLGDILNLLTKAGFEYYIRLAGETIKFPFCKESPQNYNQQLNIFCYRK